MNLVSASALALLGASCAPESPTGPGPSPVIWRYAIPDSLAVGWYGLPAVGPHVYFVVRGGLIALDKVTGQEVWKSLPWSSDPGAKNIVIQGNRVCVAGAWDIGCFDAEDGRLLWSIPLRDTPEGGRTYITHTVASENSFFVGVNDGRVIALDLATGQRKWSTDIVTEDRIFVPIYGLLLSGDTLFAVGSEWLEGSGVQAALAAALDANTGEINWRFSAPPNSGFIGAPVLFRGNLIASDTRARKLRALSASTGAEVWSTDSGQQYSVRSDNGPSIIGDMVYIASADVHVYAFKWPEPTPHWKTRLGGSVWHVVPCGGRLLAHDSRPVFLDPATGTVLTSLNERRDRHLLPGDFLLSQIAVDGSYAFVSGHFGAYGIRCE